MKLNLKAISFVLTLFCLKASMAEALNFSDNFDSYGSMSNVSSNWGYVHPSITLDTTGGYNGSKAVKFVFSGEQYFPLIKYIAGENLDHLYTKFRFKIGSNSTGGCKFFKIFGVNAGNATYANWTWNLDNPSSQISTLCYGGGTLIPANDTSICIQPKGNVNNFGNENLGPLTLSNMSGSMLSPVPGQWYEVTTYNRYSTNGKYDGEMWMAINGVKIMQVTNVKNRHDTNPRVIDYVSFGDYSFPGTNVTVWFDNIELSDQPFTTTNSLAAPTGLKILSK